MDNAEGALTKNNDSLSGWAASGRRERERERGGGGGEDGENEPVARWSTREWQSLWARGNAAEGKREDWGRRWLGARSRQHPSGQNEVQTRTSVESKLTFLPVKCVITH